MSQTDRVQTSVYFPKEVYAALVKWAEEEDRSVSNLVVRLVAKAIEEKESKWSGQFEKSAGMMPKLTIDKVAVLCELDQCSIVELAQAAQKSILQTDVNLAQIEISESSEAE